MREIGGYGAVRAAHHDRGLDPHRRRVALIVGLKPMTSARTKDDYAHKAKDTAESALSSVQTARLAAQVGSRGDAFGPYVSVLLSESETCGDEGAGLV